MGVAQTPGATRRKPAAVTGTITKEKQERNPVRLQVITFTGIICILLFGIPCNKHSMRW